MAPEVNGLGPREQNVMAHLLHAWAASDEFAPRAVPLRLNTTFWSQVDSALRGACIAAIVLSVNYLSNITWLPDGNLVLCFALLGSMDGAVGGILAFTLASVENFLLSLLATLPIAYGLAQIRDDESFAFVFCFVVFAANYLIINAAYMGSVVIRMLIGILSTVTLFTTRATISPELPSGDIWFGLRFAVNILFACGTAAAVQALPLPLPPDFSMRRLPHMACLRVKALDGRARELAGRLLHQALDAALDGTWGARDASEYHSARASLEVLGISLRGARAQQAAILGPADTELRFLARGASAGRRLTSRVASATRQERLLHSMTSLLSWSMLEFGPATAPTGLLVSLAPPIRALAEAWAETPCGSETPCDSASPEQLRALTCELGRAYAQARSSIAAEVLNGCAHTGPFIRADAFMGALMTLGTERAASLQVRVVETVVYTVSQRFDP
jgi:hypothetical protein